MKASEVILGNTLVDIVTGFSGIAIAKVEFLNGCVQVCVKPKAVDNKIIDGVYLDVAQLSIYDAGITRHINPSSTGGPQMDTPRG